MNFVVSYLPLRLCFLHPVRRNISVIGSIRFLVSLCTAHDPLHHRIHIHLHTALGHKQLKQPLRTACLGEEKGRQIDGIFLPDHILRAQHFVQRDLQLRFLHLQKLSGRPNQLLSYRITVTILGKLV